MPQTSVQYKTMFTPTLFRFNRETFVGVGIDNFTNPPSQNPDMFEELTNVMPIVSSNLQRRWGYELWNTANSNLLVAKHINEYRNNTLSLRFIIFSAADGTGTSSTTNDILVYTEAGVFDALLLTPSTNATTPYLVNSRDYVYISDGIIADLVKWNGQTLSKWGIAAPTTAPSILIESGQTILWQPNTVFSTMGVIVDTNGNTQQLISVNSIPLVSNTTDYGTSGDGQPVWNQTLGGTTQDNTITWTNVGQIGLWQPNTTYPQFSPIYDPKSGGVYIKWNATPTTPTNAIKPNFSGVSGTFQNDSNSSQYWGCIGNVTTINSGRNEDIRPWTSATLIQRFDHSPGGVIEPIPIPSTIGSPLPIEPVYIQLNLGAPGNTGGATTVPWSLGSGQITVDNQLTWLNLSSATWAANSFPKRWLPSTLGTPFTAIKDSNLNIQVCSTPGAAQGETGATVPTWLTTFGAVTQDNTVQWTCVGSYLQWLQQTQYFLPSTGWVLPSTVEPLGGSQIKDSNAKEEFVTNSGISQSPGPPTWNAALGGTTTDNSVTWTNNGPFPVIAGSVTLLSGRNYFVVFRNSNTGNISDLSPVSISSGVVTNDGILLTNIPISPDPQVTDVIILATADGGDQTVLYYAGSVPNGTTTFTDSTIETELLDNNVYQETDQFGTLIGVANNQPPSPGKFTLSYKGRLYMILQETLLFSKNLTELVTSTGTITGRWEEDWPATYQLDISGIAEVPRGIQTDGQVLYIGTERKIHRLLGDGPTNFTQPEAVFNEVGLLNQEVWHIIFVMGEPVGMIWLTPDNRVIGSDYNTYQDIGQEIQTTLNTINSASSNTSWAMFVSNGQFDLYLLAIPTGNNILPDTLCVFELKTKKWFIWNLTDLISAGVFNIDVSGIPQWIFSASTAKFYKFLGSIYQDRVNDVTPVDYPTTIRTSWFTPFESSWRKLINELEVVTNDPNLLVTVEGASTEADFTSPVTLVASAPLTLGILGDLKVMLASAPSKSRWYRLTFVSPKGVQNVLDGYSLEVILTNQI